MKLGEKIKMLRIEQEMTQPELAEKAGIEQSYLSKLENDKGSPSFDIINRIAMALSTSGMELINSLSQTYIEDHLSHIPEVAAEYESIKIQREMSLKKRFILASFCLVFGAGLLFAGINGVFYPEDAAFEYVSEGIILAGEPEFLFDAGEDLPVAVRYVATREENESRLASIIDRINRSSFVSYNYLGDSFVREVEGGRRKFHRGNTITGVDHAHNDAMAALGIMFMVAGLLGLAYSVRFKPN